MVRIRKFMAKDRLRIYEMLQQSDRIRPVEIDLAMSRIDDYLFNKEQQKYTIVVVETGNKEIIGYACYGQAESARGAFYIYRILSSPALRDRETERRLLRFIEKDVMRQHGRLILIQASSRQKYAQVYSESDYRPVTCIRDFFAAGDDLVLFAKYLHSKVKNHTSFNKIPS